MPTNHGSIEFLKFPDPQHPGDSTHMIKKWLRDSWARRKIASLFQKFTVVTVTIGTSNGYGGYTPFPDGFTDQNTIVLSIQVPEGTGKRSGDGIFPTSTMRLFAEISANGIRLYNNTSSLYGVSAQVALMRTDI